MGKITKGGKRAGKPTGTLSEGYTPPEKILTHPNIKTREQEEWEIYWQNQKDSKASMKTLTDGQIKELREFKQTIADMGDLVNEIQTKGYKTGIHMKLVSPNWLQYIPKGTKLTEDYEGWEFSNFLSATDRNFQKNIRKPITGAAAAAKELAMLRPLAPAGTDIEDAYVAKGTKTIFGTKRAYNIALDEFRRGGFDVSGFDLYPGVPLTSTVKKVVKKEAGGDVSGWNQ